MNKFPYILTISSEKGGVGKTTLATNLAIYLKAMLEDLPVTLLSFDNHFTVDHMFEIKGQRTNGNVEALLDGSRHGSDLVIQGQYGVGYIPSSNDLSHLYGSFKGPMALTRILAESGITGVIVLDTRPDLNILTQNALYAADRVLIPVKDMPSLENCKNIFSLFDQRGIDKRSLVLLPCLIDNRIKYDGMFKDQRTLLRAFAINRGYRCMDTYISKSPKVESLNTNPEGKIYPVISHARETDVHPQMTEIAKDIIKHYQETPETRSSLYHQWFTEQEGRKKEAFLARLEGISAHCPLCGKALDLGSGGISKGLYYESADRTLRGFIHTDCFMPLLVTVMYDIDSDSDLYATSLKIIKDRARSTVSCFSYGGSPVSTQTVDFKQYDLRGELMLEKSINLSRFFTTQRDPLSKMVSGLATDGSNRFIAVHPVDDHAPESALKDQQYRRIQELQRLISTKQ